jgi:putative endonuclease
MSRQAGAAAERVVAEYLCARGFVILARNYAVRGGELDIIARENDCIAFVEVKYRKTARYACPRESVTRTKQRRIALAAERWLQEQCLWDANIRFDIAEVLGGTVTLLRNAFDAPAQF